MSIKQRIIAVASVLIMAAVIATVAILADAADVTWTTHAGQGKTYTAAAIDVGDYNAPAVSQVSRQYYNVNSAHVSDDTTRWIVIPLDAATTGYRHAGTTMLILADWDYQGYIFNGDTAAWLLSYGLVTSQSESSGHVTYFYHAFFKGGSNQVHALKRPAMTSAYELPLSITGGTADWFVAGYDGIDMGDEDFAGFAAGATVGLAIGGTQVIQVGDMVGRIWELSDGSTLFLSESVRYRAE